MKLLVDHNLSPYLARAVGIVVAADGNEVVPLEDKFPRAISDIDWMSALANEGGWAFLTDDHRIRRNAAERAALRRTRLTGFFLASGWRKLPTVEKTGRLLLKWHVLVQVHDMMEPGALLEVAVKGAKLKQLS